MRPPLVPPAGDDWQGRQPWLYAAGGLARFAQTIHSRNGIILVTGPTGSGKTSTLYAALTQFDSQRLNLVTIEDPVEYRLEGATQIPVNPRAGVINAGTGEESLTELARAKAYRSYREDAAEKVLLGITTVEEALQAI